MKQLLQLLILVLFLCQTLAGKTKDLENVEWVAQFLPPPPAPEQSTREPVFGSPMVSEMQPFLNLLKTGLRDTFNLDGSPGPAPFVEPEEKKHPWVTTG